MLLYFEITDNFGSQKPVEDDVLKQYVNMATLNNMVIKGKFNTSSWLTDNMPVSQLSTNSILTPERCEI